MTVAWSAKRPETATEWASMAMTLTSAVATSTPRSRSSSAAMKTRVTNTNHAMPNFQLTTNAGTLSIKFPRIQNLNKLSRLAIYHCEQASIALRYIDGFDLNA